MTHDQLLVLLNECPIIASVQASPGSPLEDPNTLLQMAQASLGEGVRVLRLQGVENIRTIRAGTKAPTIGLIKRDYPGSEVYITPTLAEVDALIELGCEVIALDGTSRSRPGGASLAALIARIHVAGRLAMADCDTLGSMRYAAEAGADILSSTLSGYTQESSMSSGPDFGLVRQAGVLGKPVLAEGRYASPAEARAALQIGAAGVVIGGALNDPVKNTRAFVKGVGGASGPVGAVDIGGTWIRFGVHDGRGFGEIERAPLPQTHAKRIDWIIERVRVNGVLSLGIATGGTVDPVTGVVWESKPIIPDNVGVSYESVAHQTGCLVATLNDGLATAWGHACHPDFAGQRVATLALGTGVGFGWVDRGRLMMGPKGAYPRLNDVATSQGSFEDLLGGAALSPNPTPAQIERALQAARSALEMVRTLFYPDLVVRCGGVGLAPWMELDAVPSPFGHDAGLHGAAAIARWPGWR